MILRLRQTFAEIRTRNAFRPYVSQLQTFITQIVYTLEPYFVGYLPHLECAI